MSHGIRLNALALLLGAGLLAGSEAGAQTVWSIEGTGPSYGEYNAPPPACPLTVPPPYAVNPAPAPVCPTNLPFPPLNCLGGSAVDNNGNVASGGPAVPVMVHSDGIVLEMTTPAGALLTSAVVAGVVLPGPITGVACDSFADIYYITDGAGFVGVGIPPGPAACGPPPALVGPFGFVGGPVGTRICGLAYDPCTGTLWTCDTAGFVGNWTLGGAFIGGWFAPPPFGVPLSGITVNVTNGNLQITDGALVGEYTPLGALAPAGAFHLAANPYAIPLWAGLVDGLGFSLRPQIFGTPCPAGGPKIGTAGGYSFAGNAGFTITQSGATPGALSFLLVDTAALCPPLPFGGCSIWLAPPWSLLVSLGPVPASGTFTLPAKLPPPAGGPCAIPVGISLYVQFVNILGGGVAESTDALTFTIGAL